MPHSAMVWFLERACLASVMKERKPALETVEHGEQIGEELLVREAARLFEVALEALPLVLELGALAQHDLAHLGELRLVLVELARQCVDIGHHGVVGVIRALGRIHLHPFLRKVLLLAGFPATRNGVLAAVFNKTKAAMRIAAC